MRLLAYNRSRIHRLPPIGGSAANTADRFIAQAKRFLGLPYLWGGGHTSKTGVMRVDCSGLVLQAARLAGFNLDGTAADQQRRGKSVSMNALQPGDLLFHGHPASHVGIYIGNGKAIHAPRTGKDVEIIDVKEYGYFDSARRVLDTPGHAEAIARDAYVGTTAKAQARPGPGGFHTTARGETLWSIAQKVLGDKSRWQEIYALNRDRMPNPYLVYPGMALRLPGGQTSAPPSLSAQAAPRAAQAPSPAPAAMPRAVRAPAPVAVAAPTAPAPVAAPAAPAPARIALLGAKAPMLARRAAIAPVAGHWLDPTGAWSNRLRQIVAHMSGR